MGESRITDWAGVQPKEVPYVWPYIEGYIDRALEYGMGEFSKNDIMRSLSEAQMQLWIVGDKEELDFLGAAVTQIQCGDAATFLNIFLCAGEDFDSWAEHLEAVENWGQQMGCDYVKIEGRAGWKRKLRTRGYEERSVTLYKKLFRSH